MKHVAALAIALTAMVPALSNAETVRVEVPLLGGGELAILGVKDGLVQLANLHTATESSGIVYYDRHTRTNDEELAGDPPQIELITRIKLDCKEMKSKIISFTSRNYHTLQGAESAMRFDESGGEITVLSGSPDHDICVAINRNENLFSSLVQNHYYAIDRLPLFALPYRDAVDIEEINDEGEITRVSESSLLQYLRENNPNF